MAGAALGFLSGAAIGALGQYGAQKQQQKAQHEANFGQFMQQGVMSGQVDPTNPDAQKALKKYWGENYDAGMQMLQARQAAKLQLENQLKQTIGKGPPQDLQGWQTYRDHLNQMRMSGIYQGPQQQALDKEIQFASQQVMQFEREAERQKYESPEAKAAAKTAELKAGLTPEMIGAEASKAATVRAAGEAAGASAKLGVEGSPEAMDVARRRAKATREGAAEVPPPAKPWGAKERQEAWDKAVTDADKALTTGGGLLRAAHKPSPAARLRFARASLLKEGINPATLDPFKPGDPVVGIDGKTIVGKDGKPVTWTGP